MPDRERTPACGRLFDIDEALPDPAATQIDDPRLVDEIDWEMPLKPAE